MRHVRSVAVIAVALFVSACSGQDRDTTTTASSSETATSSPTPGETSVPPSAGEPLDDPSIEAAIDVADGPFPPLEGFGSLWVANHHAAAVTRIDPSENSVIAEVPVGIQPGQLATAFGSVWVPNYGESTVSRIDPATNTATTIDTGAGLTCGAPAAAEGLVWIGNCDEGTLAGIDPSTSKVERTLDVFGFPFGDGRELWIAGEDGFARLDPETGKTTMTVDLGPSQQASAASFDGDRLWLSYRDGFGGAVAWVDLSTGSAHEIGGVGPEPGPPVVDGDRVFVFSSAAGTISVVETAADEVLAPPSPVPEIDALGLAAGFGSLWLSDFGAGFVYRLEPS